jgi:hypothetical protein
MRSRLSRIQYWHAPINGFLAQAGLTLELQQPYGQARPLSLCNDDTGPITVRVKMGSRQRGPQEFEMPR